MCLSLYFNFLNIIVFKTPIEKQNHSANDSKMGSPSILSVLVIFRNSYYFNV